MANKLRTGVIGIGHLGRAHVKILSKIESCELVGCYDVVQEKAEMAALEHGTKAFSDQQSLIDQCKAISLVVPTTEHYRCGRDILESGRHLFIEKPVTRKSEEAQKLIELARANGLKLQVGHIERFNPAIRSLRDKITYPSFIEAHRLSPFNFRGLDVAVIFDLMIHDIDLCLYLTKSKVIDIQASAVNVVSEKMDIANARLTFESGCVANLTASRISPKGMRKLRIFQPKGYISIDFSDPSAEIYNLLDKGEEPSATSGFSTAIDFGDAGKKISINKPSIEKYDMLTAELSSFIDAVQKDRPVEVSGKEALEALEVAARIEETANRSLGELQAKLK